MKKHLLSFLLCLGVLCLASPFPVAQDGSPVAEILLDANADATLCHAAEELQHWLKEITGAELPIAEQPGAMLRRIRLTTSSELLANFPADAKRLQGTDGYAVRRDGEDLCIFGTVSKGVLNGVYRLLHRNTDIIWLRPNEEFGTLFTPTSTLALADIDYIDVPVFGLRGWKTPWKLSWEDFRWCIRQCANWSMTTSDQQLHEARADWGASQEVWFGHNTINMYMCRSLYWEQHPEWYSMRNGKRVDPKPMPNGQTPAQLCFSNREMTKEFCKRLEYAIQTHPENDRFAVMFEDHWDTCECPECLAPIELPDGRLLTKEAPAFLSTRFFLFLNEVARFLKENYPSKSLSTEAYNFAEIPPAIPIEDNIRVISCPIFKNVKHPMDTRANEYSWRRLHAWAEAKPSQLVVFEYYGYGSDFPRPMDFSAAGDMRYEAEQGVHGLFSEVCRDTDDPHAFNRGTQANVWDVNAIYFWVVSQLMWDPYQDVLALRHDALRRVFGSAAPDVEEFLAYMELAWNRTAGGSFYWSNGDNAWITLGKLGFIPPCREALDRARFRDLPLKSRVLLDRLAACFEKAEMVANFERVQEFAKRQQAYSERYTNLVTNGGFEDYANEKPAIAQDDWSFAGLKGWSVWYRYKTTDYGVASGQGPDGSNCIFVGAEETPHDATGELIGGVPSVKEANILFLQELTELLPGQTYFLRVQVRQDNLIDGAAKVILRWRTTKNAWEWKHDLHFFAQPSRPGQWTVIEGYFTVPPDTAKLVLMLGCGNSIGRMYFDNMELYQVEDEG